MAARDQRLQRPREIVRSDLAHERAAAGARFDDAEELQRAQRLAHRRPRHLELVRKRALRGKLIARAQFALLQQRLDLLDDALVEPAAPDRLDRGQFLASRLLLASGQVV
ncbi:MAG TPA: hypothetical protein VEP48_11675 [Methylomirabilota bacterium]|nr:hypothetical protein [Methylomirabilota bacterium]